MSTGDVYENKYLDAALGSARATNLFPAAVYIALFKTATTDTGGGTEVTGGAYERKAVTNEDAQWPPAANGQKSNAQAIAFLEATADWGTITHFAIMDAATGGNVIHHGPLAAPRAITAGQTATFQPGTLVVIAD